MLLPPPPLPLSAGICSKGKEPAYAICASGGYEDDDDHGALYCSAMLAALGYELS